MNSAFNRGNFLGGAIGGISYSASVFENKMTSTNIVDNSNRYIVSSNYNDGEIGLNSMRLYEEPTNFFGKTDDKLFHEKFNEMSKLFKGTKGDGIFRVFGHGYEGGIWDGDNLMKDAAACDKVMSNKNPRWKNVDKMEKSMLILYSCLSGYDEGKIISIAQKISIRHPRTVVVGFEK